MDASLSSVACTALIAGLVYLLYKWIDRPGNSPPGPLGIPLIGSMQLLTPNPCKGMLELSKTYGNVFSLKCFTRNVVCVNGFEAVREAMVDKGKVISGRRVHYIMRHVKGPTPEGIVSSPVCNETWSTSRRIYRSAVREFGEGRKSLDTIIQRESVQLVEEIEKISGPGRPVDIHVLLSEAVLNVISTFVFGTRYPKDDIKMKRLMKINDRMFAAKNPYSMPLIALPDVIPGLASIWVPQAARKIIDTFRSHTEFCGEEVTRHKSTIDKDHPRDLIDHYLLAMENARGGPNERGYTDKSLVTTLVDLFQAGNETTLTALRWAILYLVGKQDIQNRVCEEIDRVIGSSRQAKYEDRSSMPYTQAVIFETLRLSNVAPIGLPRLAVEDVTLQGYNIPRGTTVILNLYSSHMQADQWKNPSQFDPENFLEDGKFHRREAFVAFSGGVRGCVGKYQALQEMFILLVGILQNFRILPEYPGMEYDYDPSPGLTLSCKPYKVIYIKRK